MAVPVLPPSAPFSAEQRAYLNGFLAGIFGLDVINGPSNTAPFAVDSNVMPSPAAFATEANGAAPTLLEAESDDAPWHDPALSLDERMELAEGKPIKMRLMAAMAQLDCGQCGYLCKTYSAAIADGSEKSLKKCVPGAKETANKLKEIMAAA